MFSYYGSKSKIAGLYTPPRYHEIIEPFAGSARYSLLHWEHDVSLYDLSDYVVEVWRYLINATKSDVLSLPDIPSKVSLNTIDGLTQAERYLIGFNLCRGKAKPRHTGHGQNSWSRDKVRIANNLYKVRHWNINKLSYEFIPNREATYFIDPPYEAVQNRKGNSDRYPEWYVDYAKLAEFVKSRLGQVIVCEGAGATYLPFEVLTTITANSNNKTAKRSLELVYER